MTLTAQTPKQCSASFNRFPPPKPNRSNDGSPVSVMTPSEYKDFKGLDRQNLRDHMNDLELIFSMLGERATTEITQVEDSKGVAKLKSDAKDGGQIAGHARHNLEKRLGRPIVSNKNYLKEPESKRLLKKKRSANL